MSASSQATPEYMFRTQRSHPGPSAYYEYVANFQKNKEGHPGKLKDESITP